MMRTNPLNFKDATEAKQKERKKERVTFALGANRRVRIHEMIRLTMNLGLSHA
jgi:hypothetical protein